MDKFIELGQDMAALWMQYWDRYLVGIRSTLILAVVATLIGCLIGLLCGIFVGIILINIATRKGYTKVIKEMKSLPEEMKSGLVPEKDRTIMGENTVNPMSIDPFTWHLCLVLICVCSVLLGAGCMRAITLGCLQHRAVERYFPCSSAKSG